MPKFRFSLKSEELRGASQPNIAYIELASEADAILFAQNLETAFQADVVTVDEELATNYTLPYPAGTGSLVRMVMRDVIGRVDTEYVYDLKAGADPAALAAALVAVPILMPSQGFGQVQSIQTAVFQPGESV